MAHGAASDASHLRPRLLTAERRERAVEYLAQRAQRNLMLLDIVDSIGRASSASEVPAQAVAAFDADGPRGVVALRPSLVLEAQIEAEALDAVLPFIETIESGLVKSERGGVDLLWRRLERAGRVAVLDRVENALAVRRGEFVPVAAPLGALVRRAKPGDLDALVEAARASLREERRPDPFESDPSSFRRWVRGRLARARVVELAGRVAFVGYADVRRAEGWLVQGVYTWPWARRRGLAAAGMAALVEEGFEAGADHVQLAVVEGNAPATRLYAKLGFRAFDTLRTILFG